MNLNVQKYCNTTHGLQDAAWKCFLGCAISVLAEMLMLMVMSEEKGHIQAQELAEPIGEQRGFTKSRSASVSDSSQYSSSSDEREHFYEPDPRRKNEGRPRVSKLPRGRQLRR